MNDKELLELAAKAADLWGLLEETEDGFEFIGSYDIWNPLDSDGDALRLAVKLELLVNISNVAVWIANSDGMGCQLKVHGDTYAATRRAIVRAAAEIGIRMQTLQS